MLRLILMRHAEAGSASRDFDRPLTSYGRGQASYQGKSLLKHKLLPNLIIHSSATRTTETTQLVSDKMSSTTLAREELYNSHPDTILEVINSIDDTIKTLLIVAHNPGISVISNQLCSENRYYAFNPSEWHVLDFNTNLWSEVCTATGNPKDYE